ncbi:hypothetical protein [Roseibium sp. SCP14]|uniref:hypothetical protein n=1 Tax=Roseibium sp. SCP14 TaxID=3141375 RepID=UPI00333A4603
MKSNLLAEIAGDYSYTLYGNGQLTGFDQSEIRYLNRHCEPACFKASYCGLTEPEFLV